MANWLNFKGISSDTLNGLIISELPPIARPALRVETTEISGRDGDINDPLGYSAYDRIVSIGLYGDYKIDEIARYFAGEGEVIFSNEPDKVYNAAIIDEINFERLVKFRTATVTFHTQPYKYLLGEQPVSLEITDQTSLSVQNVGLEVAKPIITLYGSDVVEISINGRAVFQVTIDDDHVSVDSLKQEAYKDSTSTLKNRQMAGEFPTLDVGENTIIWTGNLTKITVQPKSRWL